MDAAEVVPTPESSDALSGRELEILALERQWWRYAGAKEQAIRELFGISSTRYYQLLNALIDKPEALAEDAMLIKRLRRLRATRQRARAAKRLGVRFYPGGIQNQRVP
jgi:Protein of unknown function (DUF3263)